jgi:hypothetical protein
MLHGATLRGRKDFCDNEFSLRPSWATRLPGMMLSLFILAFIGRCATIDELRQLRSCAESLDYLDYLRPCVRQPASVQEREQCAVTVRLLLSYKEQAPLRLPMLLKSRPRRPQSSEAPSLTIRSLLALATLLSSKHGSEFAPATNRLQPGITKLNSRMI